MVSMTLFLSQALSIHPTISALNMEKPFNLRGLVDDNSPFEDLNIQWISSIDGELPYVDQPEPDGMINYSTASLSSGVHVNHTACNR